MAEHQIVKPEKLSALSVGMIEQELIIPNLFRRTTLDEFKGAKGDAVNYKVEGVLPGHLYKFRADRDVANTGAEPHEGKIKFDVYSERTIQIAMAGRAYNAIHLTDEQYDFDELRWANLLRPQAKAVARMLNRAAVAELVNAAFAVTIGNAEGDLRGALIEARKVLNRFGVSQEERILLVGSDFEAALLQDPTLVFAQNVGDSRADTALGSATLGRLLGFTVVVDQTLPADEAIATVPDAMVFANAAPYVPNSVGFGSTTSFEGISLRWMRDYDPEVFRDRSVVDTYYGFRAIEDVFVTYDSTNRTEVVGTDEHFVRAIKLTLDGASDYPAAAGELALSTGVSDAKVWTPAGHVPETDPSNV